MKKLSWLFLLLGIFTVTGCQGSADDPKVGASGQGSQGDYYLVAPMDKAEVVTTDKGRREHEQRMKKQAEMYELKNPPAAKIIRFVHPDDWGTAQIECMKKRGFEGTNDHDGLSWKYANEQEEAFNIASYLCEYEYPLAEQLTRKYNSETLDALYEYYINTVLPCYEKLGYKIPKISKEKYRNDYITKKEEWSPETSLPEAERKTLMERCQGFPDNLVLRTNR